MNFIKNYFHLEKLGTNVRTEFIAGLTTFISMSYILCRSWYCNHGDRCQLPDR